MKEINHPKSVQELLENYLPNYKELEKKQEIECQDMVLFSVSENGMNPDAAAATGLWEHFQEECFQEALQNYRIACERQAWERACEKQREICANTAKLNDNHPYHIKLDSILDAPAPEFETLK